ncbi:MAG: hypothetical protein AAFZ65_00405 [Planctomycetota bacterium]
MPPILRPTTTAALLLALLAAGCVTPDPRTFAPGFARAGVGLGTVDLGVQESDPPPFDLDRVDLGGESPEVDEPFDEQGFARARGGAHFDSRTPAYGAINLIFGDRSLDGLDPLIEDLEDQKVYGIEGVVLPFPAVPVGLELGTLFSQEEETVGPGLIPGGLDLDLTTLDSYAGLRVYLHRALPGGFPLEPFLSVGYAAVFVDADVTSALGEASVGDGTSGLYWRVGLQGRLHQRLHVGVDFRRLEGAQANFQIDGLSSAEVDLDHSQIAVFFGVRL